LLERARAAWARFWFAEVDGVPLALVRVGFAVASLSTWLSAIPDLRGRYAGSAFPIAIAREWGTEWLARVTMLEALGGFGVAAALAAVHVAALIALLIGWRTRAAALAAWLLTTWFQHRNPSFLNAGDAVLRLTSLYLAASFLVVAREDRALSVDRSRALARGGAVGDLAGPTRVPAWTLRMIQIQVCVIYFVSGFWKLGDPAWRNGTALWIALANPVFSRFGAAAWAPRGLFAAGTLTVATWEFLFPVLVAWRRSRIAALGFGVAMHVFILVFLNTGVFPLAMLALYPAFLAGVGLPFAHRRLVIQGTG
jgi:hypothetical protein